LFIIAERMDTGYNVMMTKVLAIDYGSKRVGVAISDDTGTLAFPREVIKNNKKLLERIESLCQKEKPNLIVIGESKNFKGSDNPIAKDAQVFAERLTRKTGLPVEFQEEFLTGSVRKSVCRLRLPIKYGEMLKAVTF